MKGKLAAFAAASIAFFVSAACGSSPAETVPPDEVRAPAVADGFVPEAVMALRRGASRDAVVGVGSARMASLSVSRNVAAALARRDISAQLQSFVAAMATERVAVSGADPDAAFAFVESVIQTLSQSRLVGSTVVYEYVDEDGYYWVVATLNRGNSVREIETAAGSAGALFPGFDAGMFSAERVNGFFDGIE